MDIPFKEDLEGLEKLAENVSYRVSKKVVRRLEHIAQKQGRKPGPCARFLLEISLGFRKSFNPVHPFKEDLDGLDDFTGPAFSYRVSRKLKRRLSDRAAKTGRKPDPYARFLLEISLGFRAPEPAIEFPHVYPLSKKKTS